MEIEQNYVIRILIALSFILKLKIFLKIFLVMLQNGLIHETMTKMTSSNRKNKKVLDLFKDELGGKIKTEFVALWPKAYSYLDDYGNDHKKAKNTKKCVLKQKLMFQNFKDCLFNNENVYRSQQRFKSCNHDVCTEEVNKIALSANDDKRLQTFYKITTYPYGTNAFKVCESEMLNDKRIFLWNIKMINFDNYVNESKTKYNKN